MNFRATTRGVFKAYVFFYITLYQNRHPDVQYVRGDTFIHTLPPFHAVSLLIYMPCFFYNKTVVLLKPSKMEIIIQKASKYNVSRKMKIYQGLQPLYWFSAVLDLGMIALIQMQCIFPSICRNSISIQHFFQRVQFLKIM